MLDTWSQKKQGEVVWAARGEAAASQIVSMLIIYRKVGYLIELNKESGYYIQIKKEVGLMVYSWIRDRSS